MQRGLMGEAGPEAIMPLKTGPSGRLGVLVAGSNQVLPIARDGSGRLAVQVAQATGNVKAFARGGVFERATHSAFAASNSVTHAMAGPSATTGPREPRNAVIRPVISPEMANVTMRDWVEGWLARELATGT